MLTYIKTKLYTILFYLLGVLLKFFHLNVVADKFNIIRFQIIFNINA